MDKKEIRKPYTKPEIIYEIELETRAGSGIEPSTADDPFDM